MARSLLKQLMSPLDIIPDDILLIYEYLNPRDSKPDLSSLVGLFITCASQIPPIAVLIDGFDECSEDQQGKLIWKVLRRLHEARIRIYITTRHHVLDNLKKALDGSVIMEIKPNTNDMIGYISSELKQRKHRLDNRFINEIAEEISGKADGMYMTMNQSRSSHHLDFCLPNFNWTTSLKNTAVEK